MSFPRPAGLTREAHVFDPWIPEGEMPQLSGKNMVVIGGSGGVGRRIVEFGVREGARVLAVARNELPLRRLVQEIDGAEAMAIDATDEGAPAKVFYTLRPDILVVSAGAFPPSGPLHEQTWEGFAVNWQSDVKIAFHFFKAALSRPLAAGTAIILIASGAGLVGSPNSGGYAGAKRTQLFMANYSQKESDRLGLGLRFVALAPRIMPDTELGKHAVAAMTVFVPPTGPRLFAPFGLPPILPAVAG
jgi:NAD(P)-dependent dehydrogenase (short-subunit alcohol dehydrogenase family)